MKGQTNAQCSVCKDTADISSKSIARQTKKWSWLMSDSDTWTYRDAKDCFDEKLSLVEDFFDNPSFNKWMMIEGRDIQSIVYYVLLDEEDRKLLFN